MPGARLFFKTIRLSFIQAALAAGLHASPAPAQDAQAPLDPILSDLMKNPRFDPTIIGITSQNNIIHDPNIGDDGAPGPKPGDTYLEIVVMESGILVRQNDGHTRLRTNYTPYAFFLHMDKNVCVEKPYNAPELARSANPDAPRASKELDDLLAYYRFYPDAADQPKRTHEETDCRPVSRLRLPKAGNG